MIDHTEVDAIFFDVGGVLLDLESVKMGHERFIEEFCREESLELDPKTAKDQWRSVVGEHFRSRSGTTYRSAREGYAKGVEAIAGELIPESRWYPRFRAVTRQSIEPNPGAIGVIRQLQSAPLHLGIISDIDTAEATLILETFDIKSAFDSITTSEAVGRTKPDGAMFETALETAAVSADSSVMVGDRYEHDMVGADRCGMWTISYGAGSGPAVDVEIDELDEIPALLGNPS